MGSVTLSSPVGALRTHRDLVSGLQVVESQGFGMDATGPYLASEGAAAGDEAFLTVEDGMPVLVAGRPRLMAVRESRVDGRMLGPSKEQSAGGRVLVRQPDGRVFAPVRQAAGPGLKRRVDGRVFPPMPSDREVSSWRGKLRRRSLSA